MLKTHADIIDDWSPRTAERLKDIAARHRFLIFEDRKFGDIGNTVKMQYSRGVHRIGSWAHVVNAHIFPGPGAVITCLKEASEESLRELCQSVSTEITTGTPRQSAASSDGDDDENDNIAMDGSGALSPPLPESSSSGGFATVAQKSSIVTATTTISQTTEPAPPNPASLSHSLSAGESNPQDREAALVQLGPPPHSRGLLLLAEMSSAGNLLNSDYTLQCVAAARSHMDFVLGFFSQRNLNSQVAGDEFLSMTPGVSLPPTRQKDDDDDDDEGPLTARGDGKGQQYRTPREVILNDGCDVIIVGRGILNARDPGKEAERYRKASWGAYEERIGRG